MADIQDILNVPIYINGDKKDPSKLGERELYVNLANGHLYVGDGEADYSEIRVGFADRLSNDSMNIFSTSGSSVFELGRLNNDNPAVKYDFKNNRFTSETLGGYAVENANLLNISKLVLSSVCYGTAEPSGTAEVGQLYFKIK